MRCPVIQRFAGLEQAGDGAADVVGQAGAAHRRL